jgi:hypothetical protein
VFGKLFGRNKQSDTAPQTPSSLLDAVLPRIKVAGFVEASLAATRDAAAGKLTPTEIEEQQPVVREFVGDLLSAYAIDMGSHYVFATSKQLQEAGLSAERVHAAAVKNLAALLERLQAPQIEPVNQLYRIHAPENLSAAVMLDVAFMEEARTRLGGTLLVIAPHRDELWIAEPSQDAVPQLQAVMDRVAASYRDNHLLSGQLFLLGPSGWQAFTRSS